MVYNGPDRQGWARIGIDWHSLAFNVLNTRLEFMSDAEDGDPRHSILSAGKERNTSQPCTLQWSPVAWLSCLSTLGWV